jgi:tetratricopeptide (TPR) repeat protein
VADPGAILAQARAAFKAGEGDRAAALFREAQALAPRDPEIPHERGLALLDAGAVGLAVLAQGEALALDPDHVGARAQRAAAREALGDDAGAAEDLRQLLQRTGPQPALSARLLAIEDAARRAATRRLLGAPALRLGGSPLIGSVFARAHPDPPRFRAPFADLRASVANGALVRLDLVFDSMDASLGHTDLAYGGTTEDDHGRRVPLDEFSSAAIVFLSESLGIETLRSRRLLSFLLQPECGLGPHPFAGVQIGWTIHGGNGDRHYGLYTAL